MLNGYFDKIYCLNQPDRQDRWLQFREEASRIGLKNVRQIFSLPASQPFQSFCLSQHNLIGEFLKTDGVNLLALEDDVTFQLMAHFQEAMSELAEWDVLYLGANVMGNEPHTKHTRKVLSAWCTHAVAYSRAMAQWIYDNYPAHDFMMYDEWLRVNVQSRYKCYVIAPMVCWQRDGMSDLWGGTYVVWVEGN